MRIAPRTRGSHLPLRAIVLVAWVVLGCSAQQQPAATPPPVDNSVVQAATAATNQVVQDIGKADSLVGEATKVTAAIKQITGPPVKPATTNLDDIRGVQTIIAEVQHESLT
jgi:hypothetical protein